MINPAWYVPLFLLILAIVIVIIVLTNKTKLTCSGHGKAQSDGTCLCDEGYDGASCEVASPTN